MDKIERVDEFVSLYVQYSRRIYGFIRSLTTRQQDAEDVFQEVGRTLWEKFDQYQSGTSFVVWALSISHFKVLQHRRRQNHQPVGLSDAVLELIAHELAEFSIRDDDRYEALTACVQKLPAYDRELIEARYRREQSVQSLATELGRSVDSVYRAFKRIHRTLLGCIRRTLSQEQWSK
jgi:RNA polymerase sigma-70 factor (ECF subfamily)